MQRICITNTDIYNARVIILRQGFLKDLKVNAWV